MGEAVPQIRAVVPLDPTKPLGARTLINAVKSGEPLVIFPEGRLTVTGSLMKVYDGVGLIADKSGAEILPVRIEGPEATIFSRVPESKERRRLFPKFKLTVLEPTRLSVDEELKGRKRRASAGLGLYHIMSDLLFVTTDVDRTIFQATVEAARHHGASRVALEDPVTGKLSYRKLLTAARALGEKLAALTEPGETVGLMLPNANGAGVAFLALTSAGRVPAMVNFTAGSANILAGLKGAGAKRVTTSRAFIESGAAREARRGARRRDRTPLPRGFARARDVARQASRALVAPSRAHAAQARRRGRGALHLGLGRRAQGRCALPSQHADQCRAGRGAHRLQPTKTSSSTCSRFSTASG